VYDNQFLIFQLIFDLFGK